MPPSSKPKPKGGRPAHSRLVPCYVCGDPVADRPAHMTEKHPGISVSYVRTHPLSRNGRVPVIIGDGEDRAVDTNELQRWRNAARAKAKAETNVPPGIDVDPLTVDLDADEQVRREAPKPGGRVHVSQARPIVRAGVTASVAKDELAELLTAEFIADQLVAFSRALSEADGAGEAGVLSLTQAAQIAKLVHASTVDFVVSRFKGDVTRFKLTMAVALIMIYKGKVHAIAIARGIEHRRNAGMADELSDEAAEAAAEGIEYPDGAYTGRAEEPDLELVPASPSLVRSHDPRDVVADLAAQQRAARRSATQQSG